MFGMEVPKIEDRMLVLYEAVQIQPDRVVKQSDVQVGVSFQSELSGIFAGYRQFAQGFVMDDFP